MGRMRAPRKTFIERRLLRRESNTSVRDREFETVETTNQPLYFIHKGTLKSVLKWRSAITALGEHIRRTNFDLQQSAKTFTMKAEALFQARQVRQNIDDAIDLTEQIMRILDMVEAAQYETNNKRYFSAFKILINLQKDYNKGPFKDIAIVTHLLNSIESILKSTLKAMENDLYKWYDRTRNSCQVLGVEDILGEFGLMEGVGIEYSHLYDSLRVMDLLGEQERFKSQYQNTRKEQLSDAVKVSGDCQAALEVYPYYFATLTGLLLVEVSIIDWSSKEELVPNVWDSPLQYHTIGNEALSKAAVKIADQLKE
eukprot:jgi/Bigna1/131333/aug1.14_g6041